MNNAALHVITTASDEKLDTVINLNTVNYKIAELMKEKKNLTLKLAEVFGHKEGAKTYEYDNYNVRIDIPTYRKVDVKEYLLYKDKIADEFNPVKVKYEISKTVLNHIEENAPKGQKFSIKSFIKRFVIESSGAVSAKITARSK